jgi:cation diffusion facilitator CzcD-associated flavoprotein CzcO
MSHFPRHDEMLRYFEDYARHFGVRETITFRTEVTHIARLDDGTFAVAVGGPGGDETRRYDAVVVANGHHWDPKSVTFPGQLNGEIFHAHHYVDVTEPVDLREKNVLLVGMGNSAMDIACEISRVGQGARKAFIAQRSGVYVLPKRIGKMDGDAFVWRNPMTPTPWWETLLRRLVPRRVLLWSMDFFFENMLRLTVGKPSWVGLKDPEIRFHQAHPTISSELHNRLIHGDLIPKPNIRELRGDRVLFEDGTEEAIDVIILATGYNISFPFFDEDFISSADNDIPLWQRIWNPNHPGLMFLALVQPLCAMMPIAELQANLMAQFLTGRYHLPAPAIMEREMLAYDSAMKSLYTRSTRHTIQIDCLEYSYNLRREMAAGAKRAKAAGNTLPITASAPSPIRA